MASQQPRISEFLANLRRSRPPNTVNSVIPIESSEESGSEQKPDAVVQENTTCSSISYPISSSISVDAVENSEDQSEDIEQSAFQLSATRYLNSTAVEGDVRDCIYTNESAQLSYRLEDSSPVQASSNSTATTSGTSLVPQPCTCVGYTDYTTANQPLEVAQSKVTQSHASTERQSGTRKQYGRTIQTTWHKSILGSLFVLLGTRFIAKFVAWPSNMA